MKSLYSELQWLPKPPINFSESLKRAASDKHLTGVELQALASFALDLNQLTRLAKVISKVRSTQDLLTPLTPFRLGILSSSTYDFITPALVATAARHGVSLEAVLPNYGQVAQEALSPDSIINTSKLDAVLLAIDFRSLPLKLSPGDVDTSASTVNHVMGYLRSLRDGIKANADTVCIFQTFAPPAENLFGSLDRVLPGTLRYLLNRINEELAAFVHESGDILLDIATLAECVGLAEWHSPTQWNMGKLAFACDLIPLYAEHVARTLAALKGKSRKVLVLDLDNTLWGGVIGDDGLEGIRLAQGDARGEAHLSVQRLALELRDRGIILAVSSKNTDEIAREPFVKHPEMLLKLDHIAVFQANWEDKATNLYTIAKELSLGLDSFVFLDDNPVERNLVRALLPQVAVPELPDDPAYYVRTLCAGGYFEAITFSGEDLKRASYYQDNAKRAVLQDKVGGLDAYLSALEMTITFMPFDVAGRARIVQLINKSNQYNLTTRRYTEPEIDNIIDDPDVFTMQIRLTDIYGDNGMISVIICRPIRSNTAWEIDTWLMSCRVLGRKVENAVLAELLKCAHQRGVQHLVGVFRPTDRNNLVADHYAKLGFSEIQKIDPGVSHWELRVTEPTDETLPIKVVSHLGSSKNEEILA